LAPGAWAPFLNPNINEKIIDDPEYIVTTKNPTYYADMNVIEEAEKKKKEEEEAEYQKQREEQKLTAEEKEAAKRLLILQSFTSNGVSVGDNKVLAKVGGKWGVLSKITVQRSGFQRSGYVIESPRSIAGPTGIDTVEEVLFKTGVAKEDGGIIYKTKSVFWNWEIHMNPDNSFYVEAITGTHGGQVKVKTENFMANENGIVVIPINSGGKLYSKANTWAETTYPPDPGIFIESIMFKAHIPKL